MADGEKYLRSPREASRIYDLNGTRGPRARNLFAVNFRKAGDTTTATSGTTSGTWNKDLGFVVKSVDRPSIEPKVEELNQYGKKRLIQTGYKLGPTRIVFYDTADSMVMKMFAEYAKYFFGDFRHAPASTGTASTDWQYDVTLNDFKGASTGFGFNPQAGSSTETDFNAQFFFDSISVYQVFGNKYVKYDLINPKITQFDPDELDYSISEIATITMTVQAEAILFTNDYQPQDLTGESFLSQAFGSSGSFNGDVLALPSNNATNPVTSVAQSSTASVNLNDMLAPATSVSTVLSTAPTTAASTSAGLLSAYGNYNFGTALSGLNGATLSSDLSVLAATNPILATALGLTTGSQAGLPSLYGSTLQSPYVVPTSISQATLDQARAAVAAAGLDYGRYNSTYTGDTLAYATIASGAAAGLTPREQVYNRPVPPSQVTYVPQTTGMVRQYTPEQDDTLGRGRAYIPASTPASTPANSWNSADQRGIALTPLTYGAINAQTSGTTQIGFNERTTNLSPQSQPYGTGTVRPRPMP